MNSNFFENAIESIKRFFSLLLSSIIALFSGGQALPPEDYVNPDPIMRYNGRSFRNSKTELKLYNRLTINDKGEPTV